MAKAGFWLRGAKGKLAGASMGKGANGQTIMREIVTPKNPRSNAQLMQRAIMATVMQAYSAGKVIFDHSFQGRSVGAQNQQRFMSINARSLRAIISADIDGAVEVTSQQGRVVAPGVPGPVPCTLQVSEGTLVNTLIPDGDIAAASGDAETLAQYCARLGLTTADLFTFVAFVIPENASTLFVLTTDDTDYSKQFGAQFVYARYQVKASALTSDTLVSAATLADILELTESNFTPNALTGDAGGSERIRTLVAVSAKGSFAWIRSRFDEGLRSSERMILDKKDFGIVSEFALAAWKQGAANLGDSELILEGGDL